jgi:hypothetical protein
VFIQAGVSTKDSIADSSSVHHGDFTEGEEEIKIGVHSAFLWSSSQLPLCPRIANMLD